MWLQAIVGNKLGKEFAAKIVIEIVKEAIGKARKVSRNATVHYSLTVITVDVAACGLVRTRSRDISRRKDGSVGPKRQQLPNGGRNVVLWSYKIERGLCLLCMALGPPACSTRGFIPPCLVHPANCCQGDNRRPQDSHSVLARTASGCCAAYSLEASNFT